MPRKSLQKSADDMPMGEFVAWAKAESSCAVNEAFKWGTARGWIERVKGDDGYRLCF